MKKNIKTSILLVAAAATMASCSDFLEEYSQDKAQVETWKDLDELLLGDGFLEPVLFLDPGDYNSSGSAQTPRNLDIIHFMSDEIKENVGVDYDQGGFRTRMFSYFTWQRELGVDEDLRYTGGDDSQWNTLYSKINTCNMVLSLIDEQPEATDEDVAGKQRVKGEAYFLRAAYYFLLANLYAQPYDPQTAASTPGVPVKLTEYVEDRDFVRDPLDKVYAQVLDDLERAEECLTGKTRVSVYRPDLTATILLRSRVLLYMQNWEEAAREAQRVLDLQDGLLDLHTLAEGADALYRDSPATIFSMGGYLISVAFADYRSQYGGGEEAGYLVSDEMAALYQHDDLRSRHYIGTSELFRQSPVFLKVSGQQSAWGTYNEVSDCFLLRTPEAYLTLAEASAFSGDEPTAQRALKTFLATRMETTPEVTATGNALIDLIRNERAREFLLEGHRWFDLRRYTVCQPYPWSKPIEHGYTYYTTVNYENIPLRTDYYRLETNDQAYTLPLPRSVIEFQVSLGDNPRPSRKPYRTENY